MKTFNECCALLEDLKSERQNYEASWRDVSDYIVPGRGILQTYAKSRKPKIVSQAINTIAKDALGVLTSGMHGGLTSPSRPWFSLDWVDNRLQAIMALKLWLQQASKDLHKMLHASNFYSVINSFYTEVAGFGTGCIYIGEDAVAPAVFRFELLTVGEYYAQLDSTGQLDYLQRYIFRSPKQLVDSYGEKCPESISKLVAEKSAGANLISVTLLETTYKTESRTRPYERVVYLYSEGNRIAQDPENTQIPLETHKFHEAPYVLGVWDRIGADQYGVGPGNEVVPDVKRLQQMEKSLLMGVHKQVDPPTISPSRLRGQLNTLPGGQNFGTGSVLDSIKPLYEVNFEHRGVESTIARIEQRIQRKFFNDIFLTASRDPNASPYKAAEVTAREQEKMLRLGPIIEQLIFSVFYPLVTRCLNIATRKELIAPLPPDMQEIASDYRISIVSPLATAQRRVALEGIQTFLTGIGQMAQVNPEVLDRVDADKAVDHLADISGAPVDICVPVEDAMKKREARAKQQAQEKAAANQAVNSQMANEQNLQQAQARVANATAGSTMIEAQQMLAGGEL